MKRILISVVFVLIIISCTLKSGSKKKPNIVFIMMDDLGYSQISYTSETINPDDYDTLFLNFVLENGDYSPDEALEFSRHATPTMSKMAKEGAIFSNAYAASNLCSPSRMGIATGMNPNRMGIYRNVDCEAQGITPGSILAERLHEQGYATAHVGKWHIGRRDDTMIPKFMEKHGIADSAGIYPPLHKYPQVQKDLDDNGYRGSCLPEDNPLNNGFDYYYGYNMWESPFYNAENVWKGFEHAGKNPEYNTDLFTDLALDFMDKSVNKNQPFHVQLHLHAVHAPLDPKAPDEYYNKFNSESYVLNNFYAHVFAVDESIRRINEFLEEHGIRENTIIVFTSDNGGSIGGRSTLPGNAPYRGHKGNYFMGGIRVPLFFYWPDAINESINNDHLVSHLDIMPTILDAAGITPPEGIDGKSLLPYLKGQSTKAVHEYLLWSGIHARAWGFMSNSSYYPALKSREMAPYASVVIKDDYALRYVSEIREGLYKDLPDGKPAHYEMYNISEDPGERNNLIDAKPEISKDLKTIWETEAQKFPPPYRTGLDKWKQIIPEENENLRE